ncbi:MAG: 2,3-bisphosphoglycerate-independent phosphoglycerate mutase [Peptoniphilus sp.]|nr:2,3-bisphosphoglycerate-independent phosphoglycerate mutase [Peptoniphilus sp.]MDD7363776.1 2,3-bisphosphoglycerate-independent phosphoglycerate mutase [Bacillota bacterium]MDY6044617.1 2,3-bisphosphoglycerate-independent phosphoglycerate mutase [Peptoniphilus sp.]
MSKPFLLAILDGLGLEEDGPNNAFYRAKTPTLDRLMAKGYAKLQASGEAVGLPAGQMGNSEVGHTNIGAGRVVFQELTRITKDAESGVLEKNEVLEEAFSKAKGSALHLVGLVSDGGVHSHRDHLYALVKLAKKAGVSTIYIHAILDGRDVPPTSAREEIKKLEDELEKIGAGEIASLVGRFYAMDRDTRWNRVKIAYDLLVSAKGRPYKEPDEVFELSYRDGNTDEFFEPSYLEREGEPVGRIEDDDVFLFFNFRPDRAREIVRSFADPDFSEFPRVPYPNVHVITMIDYDETIPHTHVIYPKEEIADTLGETLSENGLRQLRIAETEKYAHVTFFLNGGKENPYRGEYRILIPSPKVATYDLQPEMNAELVGTHLINAIEKDLADVYIVNYANPDMVGHTGMLDAAIEAVEAVDTSLGRVLDAIEKKDGRALITADHGNCDVMKDEAGNPVTSHTTNPVPLISFRCDRALEDGILADIAPTILEELFIEKPEAMTGRSLWK